MKISDLPDHIANYLAVDEDSGCWLWLRSRKGKGVATGGGYGQIVIEGRAYSVHRVVWEFFYGPIPPHLEIDHVKARGCKYSHCANPEHLETVTHAENVRRCGLTGNAALYAARSHCANGHEFTIENTEVRSDSGRRCRTCRRETHAAKMIKKRLQ